MFAGYRHCKKCGKALMGLFDGALCDECEKEENRRMTKEEAITNLNMISVAFVEPVTKEQRKLIDDTFDMAIKALEQQPCDNAISRQAVLDTISELNAISFYEAQEDSKECYYEIRQAVKALPLVTPQQKYGKWIFVDKAKEHAYCSECNYGNVDLFDGRPHNYCPNCGCRMVEPQESEGV